MTNLDTHSTSRVASNERFYFMLRPMLFVAAFVLMLSSAYAQITVNGTITSEDQQPLIGATVLVKGTTTGAVTDLDGKFTVQVPDQNAVLVIGYTGFAEQQITVGTQTQLNIVLKVDIQRLNELVVVGYGSQKKRDVTGSVTNISEKDFIKGNIATPEQLVNGKIAGVQITSNGGAPGAGSRIRIRGGSSLNANNDPLIVIDGVPLDNTGVSGAANPLSFINPNDIENFTILKDASASAIYGSRASNGVILITTKKGKAGDKMRINFSSVLSSSAKSGVIDVLSAEEFRAIVNERGTAAQKALLGESSTNWQDQIYQTAFSHDNNLSVTGSFKNLPYRASVGFMDQNGILKTSNMNRLSGSLGINPSFFDKHLKVDVNLKGTSINNRFANQGAIGSAVVFDPTQPIRSGSDVLGGYFEFLDPATKNPNTLAPRNPLALLNQRSDESTVGRIIGNVVLDYKFHFLPELRANLNVGLDRSNSEGNINVPAGVGQFFSRGGQVATYTQNKNNKTFEFYLNYVREFGANRVDLMGGYSYQDFIRESTDLDKNQQGEVFNDVFFKTQNTLVSFYTRLNYALKERYLLTFTLRRDGSSRFSPDTRWGTFPSAAFAWKINEEGFMQGSNLFSNLKLRLGYGVTGQQDVGSDYPYLSRYTPSEPTAQYQFGNDFYATLRPEGYDANIKWEQTETLNAGIDWAIRSGRVSGAIDVYSRKTKDLLSVIPVPAGSNLTNQILTNVGNIENSGVEFTLNTRLIEKEDLSWDFGFNVTFNQNEVTNLTKVPNPNYQGVQVGGISGGVGNTVQIHTVGYPTFAYFLNKQVYDENGKPVEGLYADLNGDGLVNLDDRYRYKQADPRLFLGINSQVNYKDFSLSFVLRGNFDNYVYNNVLSNNATFRGLTGTNNYLLNLSPNVLQTGFANNQYFSDYYVENGSFLRLDNLTLGYNLKGLLGGSSNTQISLIGQNLFTITKYSGLDPEVAGGIDNNIYPRPRILSFGLNVSF
ncbi:MAG: TonB-dependent receptor [Haliscomenobacter sp.]|uniref:SusC/RagA family TonB-linked outer membrane protein n=1 Tax=Haliscomenobacter sp. TaxID=2717303 RepID=UPI0029AA1AC4|nr:TonB-dependent receptor [Haliscomenobacter sp.]MDX2070312.1 TonB-dependent receptor [Haliscomenobacter sp.]